MNAYAQKPSTMPDAMWAALAKKGLLPVVAYDPVQRISTGSISFDWALGGGIPRGRLTEFVGEKASGKTTSGLIISAYVTSHPETMRNGGLVAYIDTEHTYPALWAEKNGVNPDRVHLYQPETGEQAQDLIRDLLRAKVYDVIIYDSIAETLFAAEAEAEAGKALVGVAARQWNVFVKQIKGDLALSGTALIMINQWRDKVGVMFGDPRTTPGGKGIPFAASIRVEFLTPERDQNKTTQAINSITIRPQTTKNKTAEFPRKAEVSIIMHQGAAFVNPVPELTDIGKKLGVFTNKEGGKITGGGYWYLDGEQVGTSTGEPGAQAALIADPELLVKVEARVRETIEDLNRRTVAQPQAVPEEPINDATGEVISDPA